MSSKGHRVHAKLTKDQFSLLRRRAFVEDLTVQAILSALVNAYIAGDVSVTAQGRYMLSPPSDYEPIIEVEKAADVIEIEPNWGVKDGRPQVGATSHRQKPRNKPEWGTRELARHLRKSTGRRVTIPSLRDLLNTLDIPKGDNGRWSFEGPDSETVNEVKTAIEEGVYDSLVLEGIREARKIAEENEARETEIQEAVEDYPEQRRIQHLKRLRQIEES